MPAATPTPRSYHVVGSGSTGHAESVQVTYDPAKISYGDLLQIYFSVAHDPTELNRQGPDTGTQYRSTIFPQDAGAGEGRRRPTSPSWTRRTSSAARSSPRSSRRKAFYPAEGYHQNYLTLNPTQPYIVYNDLPKIANLKRLFPDRYRADPVLVSEASLTN